jgi:hypothetical protein
MRHFDRKIAPCFAVFAVLWAVALLPGCNVLLGLDQFRDFCPPEGVGVPPNCTRAGTGGASSGTASGGSGGGGGSSPCTPGHTRACYDGPSGTEKVGVCKGGTETCKGDGSGYGGCAGETKPTLELCASTDDEDCDGHDCVRWTEPAGASASGSNAITAVVVDPSDGGVLVAGFANAAIHLAGATIVPSATNDVFVAKLDASGKATWTKTTGCESADLSGPQLALDGTGSVFLAGALYQSCMVDGKPLDAGAFLVKLAVGGGVTWAKGFGGSMLDLVTSVAATPEHDAVMAGIYSSVINFGDGTHSGAGSYIAKIAGTDGSGCAAAQASCWAQIAPGGDALFTIAVDPSGSVGFGGSFGNAFTFGGKTFDPANATGYDNFIFGRLQASGALAFGHSNGGMSGDSGVDALTADADGALVFAVHVSDPMYIQSEMVDPAKGQEAIVKWNVDDTFAWLKQYRPFGQPSLASDSASDVVFFGLFEGTLDFGAHPLDAGSGKATALLKMSKSGSVLWDRKYPTTTNHGAPVVRVAVDAQNGTSALAGLVFSSLDFGAGAIAPPAGKSEPFVAAFGQ